MDAELSPKAAEIIECARALLAAGGYNSFSYADISDRVHLGKAGIHHHFPTKAELVRAVVAKHRAQTRAGLAALDRELDEAQARLQAYAGYWAECIRKDTPPICICAVLASELPMLPREVADEVRGYFHELSAWLASVLQQGCATGQMHLQDTPAAEAKAFMATVYGAMLTARALGNPDAFESIAQAAIRQLVKAD